MGDDLDRLSEVFADFMTPDEEGNPWLESADLGNALEEAGIPRELATRLGPHMDPKQRGRVSFEDFVNVCMDAAHPETTVAEDEAKYQSVFDLLANRKKQRITVGSLERARKRLHFNTSQEDLEKMVKVAATKQEFGDLWRQLDM